MKIILVIFFFVSSAELQSTPQDSHYIAAVVEYAVSRNVEDNRAAYVQLIEDAANQSADIVVFPELTLTNSTTSFEVPINGLLRDYPVPALHPELYDNLLVSMSEAARTNKIYVVINTQEQVNCVTNTNNEQCPEAKVYIFNTNVVFDRSGAVIDRYRKINLFGEPSRTPALNPDLGIFQTDFGVTFGHFVCFDLMFQVPAVQVVQKMNITDVVFTTMWFSELPYLTAVQIQEAYAYALNVNFLASGANNPAVGSAGSGIYSGKAGALISIMPGVSTTRLLVSKVPKIPGQVTEPVPGPIYDPPSEHDGLRLITDPSLVAHISRPLVPGSQEFTLTDKEVSCSFRVTLNERDGATAPYFRAVVQDGTNTYSKREIGVIACLIVACKNSDLKSCLYRNTIIELLRSVACVVLPVEPLADPGTVQYLPAPETPWSLVVTDNLDMLVVHNDKGFDVFTVNSTARFEELSISATFPTPVMEGDLQATDSAFFPLSSKTSIMPLEPEDYTYEVSTHGSTTTYELELTNFDEEIYSLAVWGRVFATDGQEADPPVDQSTNASTASVLSWLLLITIVGMAFY